MSTFKVGDKVRCHDNLGSLEKLKYNAIYRVTLVDGDMVCVDGEDTLWQQGRFEIASEFKFQVGDIVRIKSSPSQYLGNGEIYHASGLEKVENVGWIDDRPPNADDANEQGMVWAVRKNGSYSVVHYDSPAVTKSCHEDFHVVAFHPLPKKYSPAKQYRDPVMPDDYLKECEFANDPEFKSKAIDKLAGMHSDDVYRYVPDVLKEAYPYCRIEVQS